ncbi:MAG: DUF2703 domain-containing protein [Betaproteobacteria bacterium]|jgi:hypothetical protein|nr:MAG: DUF2703 domain-containing protein [Betaproteobacteria bacterium]
MKSLPIVWQRLVDPRGRTCDRCAATQESLEQASEKLGELLRPLNIEPAVEIKDIDPDTFSEDPDRSNRIWIAGRPIEEWLNATVSSSPCCSVCGDSECRTIEVEREVFEAIPTELIIKAALIAASRMVRPND